MACELIIADADRETAFRAEPSSELADAPSTPTPTRHRRRLRGHVQGGAIFGARRRRADDAPRTSTPSCPQYVTDSDADLGANGFRRSPPTSCRHATDANREATFRAEPSGELADDAPTTRRGPRRRVVLSECRTRRRRADVTPTTRRRHRVCRRVRCEWLAEAATDILPTHRRRRRREGIHCGLTLESRRRRADDPPPTRRRHRSRCEIRSSQMPCKSAAHFPGGTRRTLSKVLCTGCRNRSGSHTPSQS